MALQPIWKFFNTLMPLYILTTVYGIPIEQIDDNLKEIKKNVPENKNNSSYPRDNLDFWFLNEEDDDFQNEVEALALQMMELVSTLITKPNLYMIIKFGLFPLVNTICHFLLISKEQVHYYIFLVLF